MSRKIQQVKHAPQVVFCTRFPSTRSCTGWPKASRDLIGPITYLLRFDDVLEGMGVRERPFEVG